MSKPNKICGISKRHLRRLVAKKLKSNKGIIKNEIENRCEEYLEDTEEENLGVPFLVPDRNNQNCNNLEDAFFSENLICKDLKRWAVKNNVSCVTLNNLLKVLHKHNINVPVNYKTFLKTPKSIINVKNIAPGEYLHFGISNCLMPILKTETSLESIDLNIGIDGLPLTKSSGLCLWPILILITNIKNSCPLLAGAYVGNKKPADCNTYLYDFSQELKHVITHGIQDQNRTIKVNINAFCCDAPARAFVTGLKGHTSIHGCSKCFQVGFSKYNKVLYTSVCSRKITDDDYCKRIQQKRFTENNFKHANILESVGIEMVSKFPIEPMHLLDLGVTRKILLGILKRDVKGKRLPLVKKVQASNTLVTLARFIPSEFCRKPRSFCEILRWKSTEFRQFALYTGIVVLKDLVDDDTYYHFLLFHCAYRLLACPDNCIENTNCAQALLEEFVSNFELIYGEEHLTYNIHNLLHISDCVKQFGSVDKFAAYPFENYMQILKKQIRKPSKVLQQLYNRSIERNDFTLGEDNKIFGFKDIIAETATTKIYKTYATENFILQSISPNNCCCVKEQNDIIPVKITAIKTVNGHSIIESRRFQGIVPFFTFPMNSRDIGIIKAEILSHNIEIHELSSVLYKYVNLPLQNSNILIPLLHVWQFQQ